MNGAQLKSSALWASLRPVASRGHAVDLLQCGADFFPAIEEAIGQASEEIFFESYIFEDDDTGRRVANALAQAAARDVRVHVVVDGFGSGGLRGEVHKILAASTVKVEIFRPEKRFFSLDRQRLRRLHRKLVVVDAKVAFVGGINVLDDYFDPNHGKLEHPRLDYAVRVRGPIVASVYLAMRRLWWELTTLNRPVQGARTIADGLRLPDAVTSNVSPAGKVMASFVLRDNFRFRRTIEAIYLQAINRARRDIIIANAYFFPGVRFRRALIKAAKRGVSVQLLLQGRVEYKLQHYASQALYDELLLEGIKIIEYRKSFLHAKVAVIDDWATVGSSNIDPFSLLLAREANVVVTNRGFAQQLRSCLQQAIGDGGVPVALHHHRKRPWPVRVMNWFAFLVLRAGVALSGRSGRY